MLKNWLTPMYEADKDTGGTGAGTHTEVVPAVEAKKEPAKEEKKPAEATFSKADIDRAVEEAQASGNQAALKAFLKLIGAKDVEDAKRIAAEYADLAKQKADAEAANKSELDKAKSEAAEAKLQGDAALTKARGIMVEAQITVLAAELGARNRDHVAALMNRGGIVVDMETASVTGVREALLALKSDASTAYLFAAPEPEAKKEEAKTEEVKAPPATHQVPATPTSAQRKTASADEEKFKNQQDRQFNAMF